MSIVIWKLKLCSKFKDIASGLSSQVFLYITKIQSSHQYNNMKSLRGLCGFVQICFYFFKINCILSFSFFFKSSCLLAVSIGWEGGVYVQTCGHTLHIDCHKSYMESLRVSQLKHFKGVCVFPGIKYFYSIYILIHLG